MTDATHTAEIDAGLIDRLYRAIVLDFEGRGEAWMTDDSGDTLAHAAAVVAEREVRTLSARLAELADVAEERGVTLGFVNDLLDEYAATCNPAPYTSERALFERLCGVTGRVIPPGSSDPSTQEDDRTPEEPHQ